MNLYTLYKKYANRKHTIGYKFILSLFVGIFGIINFGYCLSLPSSNWLGNVEVKNDGVPRSVMRYDYITLSTTPQTLQVSSEYDFYCFIVNNGVPKYSLPGLGNDRFYGGCDGEFCCFSPDETVNVKCDTEQNCAYKIYYYKLGYGPIPSQLTKGECQVKYNLIPIENVDQHYCETNDLCPICEVCEEGTGLNWSALFINNIQYPGAPTIKLTIPEEIEREQNTDEEETNIDVIGYGYDQDKMQQMVNTQYYKPTAEEMSGLMEKVAEFLPLVAVALLIARIRRVIKKVF